YDGIEQQVSNAFALALDIGTTVQVVANTTVHGQHHKSANISTRVERAEYLQAICTSRDPRKAFEITEGVTQPTALLLDRRGIELEARCRIPATDDLDHRIGPTRECEVL